MVFFTHCNWKSCWEDFLCLIPTASCCLATLISLTSLSGAFFIAILTAVVTNPLPRHGVPVHRPDVPLPAGRGVQGGPLLAAEGGHILHGLWLQEIQHQRKVSTYTSCFPLRLWDAKAVVFPQVVWLCLLGGMRMITRIPLGFGF